jgi:hypothetical protein
MDDGIPVFRHYDLLNVNWKFDLMGSATISPYGGLLWQRQALPQCVRHFLHMVSPLINIEPWYLSGSRQLLDSDLEGICKALIFDILNIILPLIDGCARVMFITILAVLTAL